MKSNKIIRKFDNYAVPYLYSVILACAILGYVIRYSAPQLYLNLLLIPHKVVLDHQYWRLFTWIFTNPYQLGGLMIIFLPINLFFYFSLGRALENYWGKFLYNLYVFGGMLLTNIVVVLSGYFRYVWSPNAAKNIQMDLISNNDTYAAMGVTRLMFMSIFLAFAVVGGEQEVLMYFVIPVKMKWLAVVDLLFIAYYICCGTYFLKFIALATLINFGIYFFLNKKDYVPDASTLKRRRQFEKAKKSRRSKHSKAEYNPDGTIKFRDANGIIPPGFGNPDSISIHKCAVCGLTEKDNPNIEFRFCSKCNGNYEYCSNHLYTHQHIQ